MSVRMAIVKLAALGAAGALIGGGAVHIAEQPNPDAPEVVKQIKPARHVHHVTHAHSKALRMDQASLTSTRSNTTPAVATAARNTSTITNQPMLTPEVATPVPAPPMLWLFGAAASGLAARRKRAKMKAAGGNAAALA